MQVDVGMGENEYTKNLSREICSKSNGCGDLYAVPIFIQLHDLKEKSSMVLEKESLYRSLELVLGASKYITEPLFRRLFVFLIDQLGFVSEDSGITSKQSRIDYQHRIVCCIHKLLLITTLDLENFKYDNVDASAQTMLVYQYLVSVEARNMISYTISLLLNLVDPELRHDPLLLICLKTIQALIMALLGSCKCTKKRIAKNDRSNAIDTIACLMPGLLSGLLTFITSDPTLNSDLINMCVSIWTLTVIQCFNDNQYFDIDKYGESIEHLSVPSMCGDYDFESNASRLNGVVSLFRSAGWRNDSGIRTHQMLTILSFLSYHSSGVVKVHFNASLRKIFNKCCLTLVSCQTILVNLIAASSLFDVHHDDNMQIFKELVAISKPGKCYKLSILRKCVIINLKAISLSSYSVISKESESNKRMILTQLYGLLAMNYHGLNVSIYVSDSILLGQIISSIFYALTPSPKSTSPLYPIRANSYNRINDDIISAQFNFIGSSECYIIIQRIIGLIICSSIDGDELYDKCLTNIKNQQANYICQSLVCLNAYIHYGFTQDNVTSFYHDTRLFQLIEIYLSRKLWKSMKDPDTQFIIPYLILTGLIELVNEVPLEYEEKFMMDYLYLIFELLHLNSIGSNSSVLADQGLTLLTAIAHHFGDNINKAKELDSAKSVYALVSRNVDYLFDRISHNLQYLDKYPNTPDICFGIIQFAEMEILPTIYQLLIDIYGALEFQEIKYKTSFIPVIQSALRKLILWYPAVVHTASMAHIKQEEMLAESGASRDDSSSSVLMHHHKVAVLVLEHSNFYLSIMDSSFHGSAISEITIHALNLLGDNPTFLLPKIHYLWPSVVRLLSSSLPRCIINALELIKTMINTSGDFMVTRIKSDIWPLMNNYLKGLVLNENKTNRGINSDSVYPNKVTHYSEASDYTTSDKQELEIHTVPILPNSLSSQVLTNYFTLIELIVSNKLGDDDLLLEIRILIRYFTDPIQPDWVRLMGNSVNQCA